MAYTIITIADAVVARINEADLGVSVDAQRYYVPVFELPDLEELKISVVPAELSVAPLSRRDDDFDYVIDVGIMQRVDTALETADAKMELVGAIIDLFRSQRIEYGAYGATILCVAVANRPIFAPDHLAEKQVFTSVVRLTFRESRSRP